ncbi:MAG: hypothetical protein IKT63_02535 [Oscillospiraceae bacterium]|nr:hypothetical protein [Oscillospiraceae bacterium]
MKKNKMMRLASGLLVAVLITTSTISGTYAKYVTEGKAYDEARVAKFGVTVEGTVETGAENELFVKEYDETGSVTVSASVDVVAPGTDGKLTGFTVTGVPEVSVAVDYNNADLVLTGWEDEDGNYYCPLIFTVTANGEEKIIYGAGCTDMADFEAKVEEAVKSAAATYGPNTDLSTVETDLVVEWEWPFSTNADNDIRDTYLGDQAAEDEDNAATISFSATCTVTQID